MKRLTSKEDYVEIKEDNEQFLSQFKKFGNIKELLQKSNYNKQFPKVENTFEDLIKSYKSKGYKIPDLSVKHNLFKPSPLLLENKHIEEYYRYQEAKNINIKDCKFLQNLESKLISTISTCVINDNIDLKIIESPSRILTRKTTINSNNYNNNNIKDKQKLEIMLENNNFHTIAYLEDEITKTNKYNRNVEKQFKLNSRNERHLQNSYHTVSLNNGKNYSYSNSLSNNNLSALNLIKIKTNSSNNINPNNSSNLNNTSSSNNNVNINNVSRNNTEKFRLQSVDEDSKFTTADKTNCNLLIPLKINNSNSKTKIFNF